MPVNPLQGFCVTTLGTAMPNWKGETISRFILVIAELGGYMGRVKDFPPGNIIIWRGISRLYDIMIGFNLRGSKDVGN